MEILYILVPSVAIPLAIAFLFFFICVCRNNQKSSSPPVQRQPKHVRGQNVEMSMLNAYKPKVKSAVQSCIYSIGFRLKQNLSPSPAQKSNDLRSELTSYRVHFQHNYLSLTVSKAAGAFFRQCVHVSVGPAMWLPYHQVWARKNPQDIISPKDSECELFFKISKKEIPYSSNEPERDEQRKKKKQTNMVY